MAITHSFVPGVVIFTANPATTAPLDLEGELRAITTEIESVGCAGALRFSIQNTTTPAAVQRALLVERATVIQFSGHGQGTTHGEEYRRDGRTATAYRSTRAPTGIMLHDDSDASLSKPVSGRALGNLFATVGSSVRLVFLNACHSEQQAAAIIEHVDFVIGVSGSITDEAARVFAAALYRALALGRSVSNAFTLGVNALMLEGLDADIDRPALHTRPGADPSSAFLVDAPAPDDGAAWDVYLTYAKPDRASATRLAKELHYRNLRVFFDEWEIRRGEAKSRRREEGFVGSMHGLVALSAHTKDQPWALKEYEILLDKAVDEGKLLIPVLLGGDDTLVPPFLHTFYSVDLREASAHTYREGVDAITSALKGRRPGPPPRIRCVD